MTSPGEPGAAVLVGAGDIAQCGSPGTQLTATLIDNTDGTVFTAGDNAYMEGSAKDFAECYDPTWGRNLFRTNPVPGNHEYQRDPRPYYDYFGPAAGPRLLGYYAYDVGFWRILALNSEIDHGNASAQMAWLKGELGAHQDRPCVAAIWHRPLFTSGPNGQNLDMTDIFRALYDANVDVVINGHDHEYERFAPQDANGRSDPARGIREFVVGTGGAALYDAVSLKPNSERLLKSWGVLKLTLNSSSYNWDFMPVIHPAVAQVHDTGTASCH